jgi:hypothetical protein
MYRLPLIFLISATVSGCAAVTPSHDIPVKTEYIEAAVQVGDTLEVTMIDGEEKTIEVTGMRMDAIETADGDISISNIQKIVKRSWTEPAHPCGANEPVGCSIPEVLLLSEEYKEQAEKFHPSCVTHDFCYRHGVVTYGVTREECDADFLAGMKKSCGGYRGLGLLDLEGYSICHTAAQQTYNVVRLKGEANFRTTTSSYCEYKLDDL